MSVAISGRILDKFQNWANLTGYSRLRKSVGEGGSEDPQWGFWHGLWKECSCHLLGSPGSEGTVRKDGLNSRYPLCTFCIGDACERHATGQIEVVAHLPVKEKTFGNFIITCSPKDPSQTSHPHVRQHHSPSIRIICGHKWSSTLPCGPRGSYCQHQKDIGLVLISKAESSCRISKGIPLNRNNKN